MNEKRYLRGVAKEAPFSSNGEFVNFSLNVEEVAQLAKGEWINLAIRKKRETDAYGNTHSVFLNEYEGNKKKAPQNTQKQNNTDPISDAFGDADDNPF